MSKILIAAVIFDFAAYFVDHRAGAYALVISILLFFVAGVFRSTREH